MKKRIFVWLAGAGMAVWGMSFSALGGEENFCSKPVSAEQGLVKGFADKDHGVCVWKGVPYAAPPVGELRFRAPAPPLKHEGVYQADHYRKSCLQKAMLTSGGDVGETGEDCLTLNIRSPQKPGSFPVMLWIHGGGFRQGTGNFEMYNGARLAAEKDVVVVTINYRIGALGYLALPELKAEDPHGSTGNYGILDQLQALKWVQRNIAGFRGDPRNVTVFGQSAGAISNCIMMASPLSAGLYHKAIIESGMCDFMESMDRGYERSQELAQKLGCGGPEVLKCLRALPEKKLMPTGGNLLLEGGVPFLPHIDGYVADKQPADYFKDGHYNRRPVIMGSNRDEIKMYTLTLSGLSLITRSTMNQLMKKLTGEAYDQIMRLYSFDDYSRPIHLFHAVATDLAFSSRVYDAAEALSKNGPVYVYRFDFDQMRFPEKMGAFHGLEISFAFGNMALSSTIHKIVATRKTIDAAQPLIADMMAYWTNFAKTGDPNGPGLKPWPLYNTAAKQRLILDAPVSEDTVSAKEIERYKVLINYDLTGIKMTPKK